MPTGSFFESCVESLSSLLAAISAKDHIRGLLFNVEFVLTPGVCFVSMGDPIGGR